MQRARFTRATPIARWALPALLILLALAGCKKEGGSSVLDALLPKGTAAKLNKDLVVIAEDLPADVEGFGFVDFGLPLGALSKNALSYYEVLYRDLADITKRRWGVDVDKLSGAGFIVFQQKPLAVFATTSTPPVVENGGLTREVMLGQVGRLTVLGEPEVVASIIAAAKQGKRLHQTKPAWLRSALVHAVDNAVFFSADAEQVLAGAPPDALQQFGQLLHGTVTIGATGVAAHVTSKPGEVEKTKALVAMGVTFASGQMDRIAADISKNGLGPLLGVLYRHYSQALWKSLQQKVEGDQISMRIGWHMPELPGKPAPAPLAERVVIADELAVAQINFGAPIIEQIIAFTDFLSSPLDRKALRDELAAELGKLVGVTGVDPRALTASISTAGLIISMHNAKLGEPGTSLNVVGGAVPAMATPWGLALSPLPAEALFAAVTDKAPGVALAGEKILGADDSMMNAFIDMTRMPTDVPFPEGLPPLRSIAVSSGMSRFALDVVTAPGQGQAFVKWLEGLPALVTMPGTEEMYKNRAQGSVIDELLAIMQNFQIHQVRWMTKPKAVSGDRVELRFEQPAGQMKLMLMSSVAAGAGLAAAVAVPYLMMRPSMGPVPAYDDIDDGAMPPPAPPAESDEVPTAPPDPAQ